ncbi:MAG TPA: ThuA domain-containing protein [bacterium]|nr:ThuA domain-containing protein [bacterium]HPN35158.1 ThuA domain-containing protein [bacterium]
MPIADAAAFKLCRTVVALAGGALLFFLANAVGAAEPVLIIKDELPQMQVLADYLNKKGGLEAELTDQERMPAELSSYRAVILYVHRRLLERTELAMIRYARQGGRLIVLHHSISSGKRANRHWFDFLNIRLANAPLEKGGYAYREPVTVQMINLAPDHYITSHNLVWPETADYDSLPAPAPAVTLTHTEVYLNHTFTNETEKQALCGFKYFDQASGRWYQQARSAWLQKTGQGYLFYFMFGHKNNDFENPVIAQLLLNSLTWQP